MKKITNSPLKILGFITIVIGLIAVLTLSYFTFWGIYLIGIGLIIYFIDYLIFILTNNKKVYSTIQLVLTASYFIFVLVSYMNWQEHNYIVFPKGFKGQAGIIFGIEGYPELSKTKFWKKTINFPENGLIITSTKVEDIPSMIRFAFADNSNIDEKRIDWDANFEIDCIVCDKKVKSWLFLVDTKEGNVKNQMTELCNQIAEGKANSLYKSDFSPITNDNKGKYLWLQNKGLSSLPNGLNKLGIYKAILTGNSFTEIPSQIYKIASLDELIMAANPISKFPCEISTLKSLKSISFAETKIKDINCDLSQLKSLEHFDISRNDLAKFPEKIKTIPNLTWLSLDSNLFKDLSFIDNRLNKIETLYLYSNKVKAISKETRYLGNLKELLIFDNEIDNIPDNISDLKNLEKLEIWDNPIKAISPNIAQLSKLKSIRIDDDFLTQTDKDKLKKWLPNCEIYFQTRRKK